MDLSQKKSWLITEVYAAGYKPHAQQSVRRQLRHCVCPAGRRLTETRKSILNVRECQHAQLGVGCLASLGSFPPFHTVFTRRGTAAFLKCPPLTLTTCAGSHGSRRPSGAGACGDAEGVSTAVDGGDDACDAAN